MSFREWVWQGGLGFAEVWNVAMRSDVSVNDRPPVGLRVLDGHRLYAIMVHFRKARFREFAVYLLCLSIRYRIGVIGGGCKRRIVQ